MQTPTLPDFNIPERIDDVASRATDIGRKAAAVIDDSLPAGVASAAHTAAVALQDAGDYVRDQDLESMVSDVKGIFKRHPGATLLAVAALGFVLVRAMSRN